MFIELLWRDIYAVLIVFQTHIERHAFAQDSIEYREAVMSSSMPHEGWSLPHEGLSMLS